MKPTSPPPPRRRSTRLHGYDYAWPGAYFVTVCTKGRKCLFGNVIGEAMCLNAAGELVAEVWARAAERYPTVRLGAHVVMPNHLHGIVVIVDDDDVGAGAASSAPTLSQFMRTFKSMSGIAVNRRLGRTGVPVWQRGFWDHVIRDETGWERIRAYINANPANWADDPERPA